MSTINLKGATSGTIALVPTAIAGSNTITLPAETGTLRSTVSSGTVLQVVSYSTGAVATGTTIFPYDDTIPQNTEGNEYLTLAITPRSATSKLVIRSTIYLTNTNGTTTFGMGLFQDSTANALATGILGLYAATGLVLVTLEWVMTSGTTSSTTFKVRAGSNGAGTTTLNGSGGARLFGGTLASSITITEVVP